VTNRHPPTESQALPPDQTAAPLKNDRLAAGCPITAADLRKVVEIRQATLANGYRLVSCHTPWSLSVDPPGRGKRPLTEIRDGQKIPWTLGHSTDRLSRVTALSANTGLVLGGAPCLIAFDLDPRKDASATDQQAFTLDLL
jgi:hypothetical protein